MQTPPAQWSCPAASAEIRVFRDKSALYGEVRLRVGDRDLGVRQLRGLKRCDELFQASALALCIGLDAMCAPPIEQPAPPPPPRRDPASSIRQDRRPNTAQWPAGSGVRLGVALLGSRGAAPSTSAGVTLSVGIRRANLRLALEGRLDAPASGPFEGGTVGSSLAIGGLSACFDWRDLGLCAVQYAGFKHTFGLGFERDSQQWLSYLGTSLRAAWRFGGWGGLGAAMWVQADRPWYDDKLEVLVAVDGGPPTARTWSTPRVGLTLGLEIFFDDR